MIRSTSTRWEMLLADLSLILFIVALAGLASAQIGQIEGEETAQEPEPDESKSEALQIAQSQALYRQVEGGPDIAQWLDQQALDPRLTLTIFVDYEEGKEVQAWGEAAALVAAAREKGVGVRTVMNQREAGDIYASLAFDAVPQGGGGL